MQKTDSIADMSFNLMDLKAWEHIFIPDKQLVEDEDHKEHQVEPPRDDSIEDGELDTEILDIPRSWVRKLHIDKQKFEARYPGNEKKIVYYNATVELYSEYHRKDLMVKRLVLFNDEEHTDMSEEHCYFKNRKDLLKRRSKYYSHDFETDSTKVRVHEWIAPGRLESYAMELKDKRESYIEGLREIIIEKDSRVEFRF